ncbi:hypothetical protein H072_10985 [Dactylellina haptotyla CBS 200.50]|uniref:Nucleoside phosphorylase domain-containing protein n=1 Tax=Dactylellina haptotyla (strain CBS 200.50) TaxID=1284197 RepID=S7ZYQ7_DACHA|nr:hypothetical protein H072_10985 [Dactylellina haptotyla CBS 200.50]
MHLTRDDYEISIICALPLEAEAVRALFDEVDSSTSNENNEGLTKAPEDTNVYTLGAIGRHRVVLVSMPGMGKISAAATAATLKQSFRKIKLTLLVGICGGVPGEEVQQIRLGDVVIGEQVIHYDFGRQQETGLETKDDRRGSLGGQTPEIRAFVNKLKSGKKSLQEKVFTYLTPILEKSSPVNINLRDNLYLPGYWHIHRDGKGCIGEPCEMNKHICQGARISSCEELKCDRSQIDIDSRRKPKPSIHFGPVASGDKIMRSATVRDEIARKEQVIAFDMEAAGAWDYLPCLLIKGVSDYADSHKNKNWQNYAALTAAVCVKAVLEQWVTTEKRSKEFQIQHNYTNHNCNFYNQGEANNYGTLNLTFSTGGKGP